MREDERDTTDVRLRSEDAVSRERDGDDVHSSYIHAPLLSGIVGGVVAATWASWTAGRQPTGW